MSGVTDRQRVTEAVNFLIREVQYSSFVNEMTRILETWHIHPMRYDGNLSRLNALLDVGVSDRSAFEKLVKLIEAKRKLLPEARRVDYQREFMAERRARLAKAVELRRLLRGAFKSRDAIKAYEKEITDRWAAERDAFVASKGKITWAERNAARAEFWGQIDATLERSIAAERAKAATNAGKPSRKA